MRRRRHIRVRRFGRTGLPARARNGGVPAAADMIGECPSSLRADMQRGMTSNSRVDDPGETEPTRRSHHPHVHLARRTLHREIEAAIRAVAASDTTQEVVIDPDVVSKLSASTAEASITFAEFSAAGRTALGKAASRPHTPAALVEGWSWMHPALLALLKGIGAERADIQALDEISNRINAPPGLQARLPPDELTDYIEKILRLWKQMMREFRTEDERVTKLPSIKACMTQLEPNLQYKTLKAALTAPDQHAQPPARPADRGKRDRPEPHHAQQPAARQPRAPTPPPAKGGQGTQQQPRTSAASPTPSGATAWKERKQVLPDAKFNEVRQAAAKRWPATCAYYLVAKCSRADCSFKHERPMDFENFLTEHKLNLDGSAKVSSAPHA